MRLPPASRPLCTQETAHANVTGPSPVSRGTITSMQHQQSNHKRSLSFNHHLSYNQHTNSMHSATNTLAGQKPTAESPQQVQLREQQAYNAKINSKGAFISSRSHNYLDHRSTLSGRQRSWWSEKLFPKFSQPTGALLI